MINTIIFDCDNTLVRTGEIHFESLNKALQEIAPEFVISRLHHESIYNGLSTKTKLGFLVNKGLNPSLVSLINSKKQEYTEFFIKKLICPDDYTEQREVLKQLKSDGYHIGCCSNAIRDSVFAMLLNSVGTDYFDIILSNQDCKFPKPSPSIYLRAMSELDTNPRQTLIIEDSNVGLESAYSSGAHVMKVNGPEDIIYNKIIEYAKIQYLVNL